MTARVPPEVLVLLDTSLGTFEKLELASHLMHAGASVPRADLRAALRLDAESLREAIGELVSAKIIEVGGAPDFKVNLGPRAQQDDFKALMALYDGDRLSVATALASSAMRRIRSMAATTFAEAFVLKRKHKDNGG
jgi:hypothetical protein